MTSLYHPTLPVTVDVDDSAVKNWIEQGWRKTQPKDISDADAAEQAGAEKKGNA